MKTLFLFIYSIVFSFNIYNIDVQENIIIEKDEIVSVDEVFKIIKEQTDYRFIYPNGLFKNAPKVSLKKGEIAVVDLLKHSLYEINFRFEIKENKIIIREKKKSKVLNKKTKQPEEIEGVVLDETTDEPLAYATVRLLNTKYYTITNEDGKFEFSIDNNIKVDSLEIRFLGFERKKILLTFLNNDNKIYLKPLISEIEQVVILSKKEKKRRKKETAKLLFELIKKYRSKNQEIKSKVFLSLNSSARNIPIEHIEGFYNGTQNLSSGITNLEVKNGRFGQNKSFSYYSLDNTKILKDFQFFKSIDEQILPVYPGNMSLSAIKSKYNLELEKNCLSCDKNDFSISFTPLKVDSRLFTGEIIFDKEELIIKKISLTIKDPKTLSLSTIEEGHVFTPKLIKLNILFNPLDLKKVQYIDFQFDIRYTAPTFSELITSKTFMYFYDYEKPYTNPYFTTDIEFRNDYDRIVALQSSDEFWEINHQLPKSLDDKRYLNFLKEYGYLINYENTIPADYIEFVKPSVISWDENRRIKWNAIKHGILKKNTIPTNEKLREYGKKVGFNSDKQSHSVSEMSDKSYQAVRERVNFSYAIDIYKDTDGKRQLSSHTIFDRNTSYSKKQRTRNRLIYINLMFDIYEHYRKSLDSQMQFSDQMKDDEIKKMFEEKFKEATKTVKKMKRETSFSSNYQELIKWNNQLALKLGVNNLELIHKDEKP